MITTVASAPTWVHPDYLSFRFWFNFKHGGESVWAPIIGSITTFVVLPLKQQHWVSRKYFPSGLSFSQDSLPFSKKYIVITFPLVLLKPAESNLG
jgi:hypothetical protein